MLSCFSSPPVRLLARGDDNLAIAVMPRSCGARQDMLMWQISAVYLGPCSAALLAILQLELIAPSGMHALEQIYNPCFLPEAAQCSIILPKCKHKALYCVDEKLTFRP